jgi:hypothetical protein
MAARHDGVDGGVGWHDDVDVGVGGTVQTGRRQLRTAMVGTAAREAGRAAVGRRTTVRTWREGEVSGRDSSGRDAINPPRACPDSAAHGSQSGHGVARHCR